MLNSYKIRFTGRCNDEFNPHEFDCTFGFGKKTEADAFHDFKLSQREDEPNTELLSVKKLYEKKKA